MKRRRKDISLNDILGWFRREQLTEFNISLKKDQVKQQLVKGTKTKLLPEVQLSFEEMFREEIIASEIEKCIDYLRKVKPPVIDEKCNCLLGQRKKSAFVAWHDVILKGRIKNVSRQALASILSKKFSGLEAGSDGGIFKTPRNVDLHGYSIYKDYFNQFARLSA